MVKITRNMDITPKGESFKKAEEKIKKKFSWTRLFITLFLVVLTAGATAGTMWYFMDQAAKTDKKTIDSLQSQLDRMIEDQKKANEEDAKDNTDEMIYENTDYDFEIEFTKKWEGYKVFKYVDEKDDSALAYYYVALPTSDDTWDESPRVSKGYASLFAISVHTKEQWKEINSTESPVMTEFVEENDTYVISWSHAQAGPSEGMDEASDYSKANDDVPQIINSIKFSK
ncbi:hypothetical protein HGB13_03225 [bacterium]|nr:hypothetical protein [bacterium]